jgi:hypothetical protein
MGEPSFDAVHEMDDAPEFLKEMIGVCHQMTEEPLLFRLDSGNDSAENIGIFMENGCHFIIKRNLRKESKEDWLKMAEENSGDVSHPWNGKTVHIGSDWKEITFQTEDGAEKRATIRMGYEITERAMDQKGQFPLVPDIEVNTWWTNTDFTDRDVIARYHAHGECERFHSELKTDMDLERPPSGKFQTNELALELAILSYNILRMIGRESLGKGNPRLKRTVKRRRRRTEINNLANMARHITEHARHITEHARKLVIGLGKSNVWREVFQYAHYAFEDFVL